jgi:RNA polymerase subunit RPABC4/transcription elongation factor Spt4
VAEGVFSGFSGGGLAFGGKQATGDVAPDTKRICANCGAETAPDAAFCPKCGTAVPAEDRKKFCHNCGRELADGDNFCPKCGTKAKE